MLAITDHDTTRGWEAAARARPVELTLVRGAEISCVRDGISLHLLAYLFDPTEPVFAAERLALRESRFGRAQQMVRLLQDDGHPIAWEQVQVLAEGTVGRPHIARALIELGLLPDVESAFAPEWIGTGGRYWVAKKELDVVDGVRMVRGAGGVAVFAHPAASKRGRTVGADVIREMAAAGLAGLEVEHWDHEPHERDFLRDVASELDLLMTGSSDYHGTSKEVRLGAHVTTEEAYERLVAQATGVGVLTGNQDVALDRTH